MLRAETSDQLQADDVEMSDPSTTRSQEHSLAERLLAKHMHEEHHSTLTVSILEARGLRPRQGTFEETPPTPKIGSSTHACLRLSPAVFCCSLMDLS